VEDDIVDLVITMYKAAAILGLSLGVGEEVAHLSEVWDISNGYLGVLVDSFRLSLGDRLERRDLPVVEAVWFAKGREVDRGRRYAVEFGERHHSRVPHLSSVLRTDVWYARVLYDATVEEVHDVERCANDGVILAETVCLWDRHVGGFESMDDSVFAIDFVCSLGE